MFKKRKRASNKEIPPEGKKARGGHKINQIQNEHVSWHVRTMDREGVWGWNSIDIDVFWADIFPKLSSFSTMTWDQILNRNNHEISVSDICPEAQKRLEEIYQNDIDSLVSLRLTGKKRLWGIRDRNVCKLLWWDPKHTVYPSKKKHS